MRIASISFALAVAGAASAQSLYSSATVGTTDSVTDDSLVTKSGTVGTLTGSASGQSDYGVLHAYASATNSGGADFHYVQGFASFHDIVTIHGGTGTGTFNSHWTVHGASTMSGTASVMSNLLWDNLPNGVPGGLPDGTNTFMGVFGTTFTYDVPFTVSASLYSQVAFNAGGVGSGTADFSETATLSATEVRDAKGNLVGGLTIRSASGHDYPTPVPEPTSLAVLGLGALGLRRRRLRRSRNAP